MSKSTIKILLFLMLLALVFSYVNLVDAEDYPTPTIEQVDFSPASYLGVTVLFEYAYFDPDVTKFNNITGYGLDVKSKSGEYYFAYSNPLDYRINFYVSDGLALNIVNRGLSSGYYKCNLLCIVERKEILDSYPYNTCWFCKIIKIDIWGQYVDDDWMIKWEIMDTLTDDGAQPPPNPIDVAIATERARWDANGDNKIGLEEVIRALQIVSGMRNQ